MDNSLIASVIIALAGLAFAAWAQYHNSPMRLLKMPGSASELLTGVQTAATDLEAVIAVATQLVAAAEQLWKTGKIGEEERFKFVFDQLTALFPDMDRTTLTAMLEGAVFLIKQGIRISTPTVTVALPPAMAPQFGMSDSAPRTGYDVKMSGN